MGDIKRAIFGATNTNDQPQTHKAEKKSNDEPDARERVTEDQDKPRPVADSEGPTHKQPTSEEQPDSSSDRTGEGNEDDYYAPSDQTRS